MIVHATTTAGQKAQTAPFGYLSQASPATDPCTGGSGGDGGNDAGACFAPSFAQHDGANEWWVEYGITGDVRAAWLQVVGFTVVGTGSRGSLLRRPVLWDNGAPSVLTPSEVADGSDMWPYGLTAGGDALVGGSVNGAGATWVWKAGTFTRVRPFADATSVRVVGINDHGDVAGDVDDRRGFLWHADGTSQAVVPPAAVSSLRVERVDAYGQIAGETKEGAQQSEFHPFTWKAGKFLYLSDALGVSWSMNDHGLIAAIMGPLDIQQPHSVQLFDTSACFP